MFTPCPIASDFCVLFKRVSAIPSNTVPKISNVNYKTRNQSFEPFKIYVDLNPCHRYQVKVLQIVYFTANKAQIKLYGDIFSYFMVSSFQLQPFT